MRFRYQISEVEPSEAFPHMTEVIRPLIRIGIRHEDKKISIFALIDSGADHCVFPWDVGKRLGIDLTTGKQVKAIGFGGEAAPIYFHHVMLDIGGLKHKIMAGFSDVVPLPLLGQLGFFDRFRVTLDYKKQEIFIEP